MGSLLQGVDLIMTPMENDTVPFSIGEILSLTESFVSRISCRDDGSRGETAAFNSSIQT